MTARLAVFVSGTGRHLENFAELARGGELDAEVALVVCDRRGVAALDRAARFELEARVLDPDRELDAAEFSARAFAAVEDARCDLVLLAGFLRRLVVPPAWAGRVLNIHPALLPAFGGKGYWGERVHRAVLERGCWFSGCTVHVVDDEYDHGPIVLQRVCEVRRDDTVDSLAARVFAEELVAYPEAVRLHLSGGTRASSRR